VLLTLCVQFLLETLRGNYPPTPLGQHN